MKTILLALLFVLSLSLSYASEVLFFEDFSSGLLPAGWTTEGPGFWNVSYTWEAGCLSPELAHVPGPGTDIQRYISPAINTADFYEMQFLFWHCFEAFPTNIVPFTISIQVSNNLTDWTSLWNFTTDGSIPQQPVSVTIPRGFLGSSSFHIAFACNATSSQFAGWYIDNVQMNINQKSVSGTWTAVNSPYYMHCDYIVPQNEELYIEPGVQVIADYDCGIDVYGYLEAQGTVSDSILFTASYDFMGWHGISIFQLDSDNIRFSYCIFEYCQKSTSELGGALYIGAEVWQVFFDYCRFSYSFAGNAGAVYVENAWQVSIESCHFDNNSSYSLASAIYVKSNERIYLTNCAFYNNYFESGSNEAAAILYSNAPFTYCYIFGNTFANNYCNSGLSFLCNPSNMAGFNNVTISSCIFWNPNCNYEVDFNYAFEESGSAFFYYCDINSAKITEAGFTLTGCINFDPLFVSNEDCHLLGSSPCINTGQPGIIDPDGSRKDMGAFPVYNKPVIQTVKDVPFDQGRKVEVFWKRSELDNTWMPNSFYTVWRGDTFRSECTVISSPLELNSLQDRMNVWWLDERNTAWQLMGQTNAYNFDYYGFACPTLQDSSATGTHAIPFKVVYQWSNGFATSAELSGYSVDNIAPDPLRNLVISKQGSQMRLDWTAVTTGTYNGTPLNELNGIWYKVYAADEPYFEISPSTYLTTTANTFNIVNYLTDNRKFFRIVVSDQP
jgi:hypothetical protein